MIETPKECCGKCLHYCGVCDFHKKVFYWSNPCELYEISNFHFIDDNGEDYMK